jgi:tRNA dimethylallyltransferase
MMGTLLPKGLVAIVGATATGKTALAVELAPFFQAEVISADSRQVYRGMDIGTAKPTPEQRAQVPHHLINVVDPTDRSFSVAVWRRMAEVALADSVRRGKQPWLVGGTGLYIKALVDGLALPPVPPDPALRAHLEAVHRREGTAALWERLRALDPVAAATIDRHNPRRLIRALEVCLLSGRPVSEQRGRQPPSYPVLEIGLHLERAALYARIDARVEEIFATGLVREVERLLAAGCTQDLPSMQSPGYREVARYLAGEITLAEAKALTKQSTRQLAKRQLTWFRKDQRIQWIQAGPQASAVARELVRAFYAQVGMPVGGDESVPARLG